MRALVFFVIAAIAALILYFTFVPAEYQFINLALAQVGNEVVTAPEPDTYIDFGPFWNQVLPAVMAGLGMIAAAIVGWLSMIAKTKFNMDIEARHREALQTALTNAGGLLVNRVGDYAEVARINVGDPRLAAIAEYVLAAAPDALRYFGLIEPKKIEEKVLARVGVMAATGTPLPDSVKPPGA